MKEYPKIHPGVTGLPCIAFDKLDGSNLRFQWAEKPGWYKFGTRTRLFDHTDPVFGPAIDLFFDKYATPLEKTVQDKYPKIESFIAYAEFFGPNSFAGIHDPVQLKVEHNEPKDIVLFDINLNKRGFVPPREFLTNFGHLHVPTVVYDGVFDEVFVESVRQGDYPVVEGVIAKGGTTVHSLWFRKVKTLSYLERLRETFGTGWEKYGE